MSVSCDKKAEKNRMMRFFAYLVPTKGLEPPTYALRVRCTTNCAKSAFRYQHVYYTAFSKRSNSFFSFLVVTQFFFISRRDSSWICVRCVSRRDPL